LLIVAFAKQVERAARSFPGHWLESTTDTNALLLLPNLKFDILDKLNIISDKLEAAWC
jgi:hypothetical protein